MSTAHVDREARRQAREAARATWERPVRTPEDPDAPRCGVPACAKPLLRADRCTDHWQPMRALVGGMAGEPGGYTCTRRTFSEAMATTPVDRWEWSDSQYLAGAELAAFLDRCTDLLYAAGWYVGVGPRGGRSLRRRAR